MHHNPISQEGASPEARASGVPLPCASTSLQSTPPEPANPPAAEDPAGLLHAPETPAVRPRTRAVEGTPASPKGASRDGSERPVVGQGGSPVAGGSRDAPVPERTTRTVYTPEQLVALEEVFRRKSYVEKLECGRLAAELNLTEAQVRIWFKNRRTKFKRQLQEQWESIRLCSPFSLKIDHERQMRLFDFVMYSVQPAQTILPAIWHPRPGYAISDPPGSFIQNFPLPTYPPLAIRLPYSSLPFSPAHPTGCHGPGGDSEESSATPELEDMDSSDNPLL